jgi:hypothetical protein
MASYPNQQTTVTSRIVLDRPDLEDAIADGGLVISAVMSHNGAHLVVLVDTPAGTRIGERVIFEPAPPVTRVPPYVYETGPVGDDSLQILQQTAVNLEGTRKDGKP